MNVHKARLLQHTTNTIKPTQPPPNPTPNGQVTDVSQLGSLEEAAGVLTPPGCRLLGSAAVTEPRPPRDTPLGPVEIPPRSYYL